jgi:hypothetical protein
MLGRAWPLAAPVFFGAAPGPMPLQTHLKRLNLPRTEDIWLLGIDLVMRL